MTRELYVCNLCGFINFHRLIYCPKCPGRMHQRDIEVGDYCWRTHSKKQLKDILAKQGLNYEIGLSY